MSEKILCGPCGYAENNKNAEKWCTVCEEGLCADCEKVHKSIKTSRNHRLMPIRDFRQIKNISISINCKDHDKRLELYCKTHDVAVCLGCVPSRHRTCSDVIPLDKAAENAKRSTALADLENTLTRTLQNIEQIITDRESALENFESQKQTIKNTLNDTRARILKKLDDLERKLLHELNTKHEHCKSEACKLLNRMKNSKRDLSCLREQTSQLKSFASDVQLFLGTHQINEAVFKEKESIKEGIKSVKNYEVYLQLHPSFISLTNEVDQLGKISVRKTTTSLPFKEAKEDQAQIQLRVPDTKRIKNVRLQLKKRFNLKQDCNGLQLTGCTMLPNGNLLMAIYFGKKLLVEYSEDGKHIRDIPCSRSPFDLTVIDNDRIALTYGNHYVEIFNKKNTSFEKEFRLESNCYGISYQDNKLFIITTHGIVITNIAGQVLKTLYVDCGVYLSTTTDRIYFNVKRDQTVHCISMTGDEIWVHKEKSLVDPRGITVDDHQNVFVVDIRTSSLIVIQHEGRSSRTLLSKTDGLVNPLSLHYNNEKKELLLCDDNGCALYNLE
ncbi:uncharacterized protein LOC127738491 [Mytilus californianus]|uniref:uncharacterized protein LOC127738491 n=1 Tax=Mytilus californianus TaxID=6549 RepID=UPI00224574D9|nr:uncharacterized protein LOC127738491 [Mytilus californianus]